MICKDCGFPTSTRFSKKDNIYVQCKHGISQLGTSSPDALVNIFTNFTLSELREVLVWNRYKIVGEMTKNNNTDGIRWFMEHIFPRLGNSNPDNRMRWYLSNI